MEQAPGECHGTSVTQSHTESILHQDCHIKEKLIEDKFEQQVQYWTKTKWWCSDKSQKILLLCGCS
jgi:hypothetical protein